ncbi:MAG: hypothetical protein E6I65_12315 [Chloroflexi bacterium]|nr:MAG: hypothetical protein E6I65_12315 [Chloroflexota bacterium]
MISRVLIKKQPGRRYLAGLAVSGLLAGLLLTGSTALAVHEDGVFQLDGNAKVGDTSTPAMVPATEDADNICATFAQIAATNPAGSKCNVADATALAALPPPTVSTRTAFVTDGAGPWASGASDDQFTGGSGDAQDVSSWKYKNAASSNDKSDIQNAFFAEYTKSIGGTDHKLAYFGGTRSSNNGDENTAFWLMQNPIKELGNNGGSGTCTDASGCPFSGVHRPGVPGVDNCYEISPGVGVNIKATKASDVPCTESATETDQKGDVLVVSAFTGGGKQPNIQVYVWMGTKAINSKSGLCVTSDCSVLKVFESANPGCSPITSGDVACAITNQPVQYNTCPPPPALPGDCVAGNTIPTPSPWLFRDVSSTANAFQAGDYIEAGIDLTALGLGGECTSTFTMNTRSSQSVNASLQDLAVGQAGGCVTTLSTKAGDTANGGSAPPTDIGTGTRSSGSDTATLTVTGVSTWGGTLTWYLCGPDSALTKCNATDGVKITGPRTLSNSSPATDFVSTTGTLTSAGKYCWTAHFEPDTASKSAGVSAADDDGTAECFTVSPVHPTLTTSASCGSSPCVLGVDTLSDTAGLSGTATEPGNAGPGGSTGLYKSINSAAGQAALGSISWTLYLPSTPACSGATKTPSGSPVDVHGDNPSYGPVTYKPALADGVGVYTFVATYNGDLPNTTAPTTAMTCATAPNGEKVTVTGTASSSSDQRWLPNDRVKLETTGGTTLTGALTVSLYSGTFTVTNGVCTPDGGGASSAITGQSYPFNPSGDASGSTYNTSNSTFFVGTGPAGTGITYGAPGAYFWLVHYDDTNLTDPGDRCEKSNVTINN